MAKNKIRQTQDQSLTKTPLPHKFRKKKPVVQDWVEAILFAFVVAMIIRNYTFQNFVIPSSSMEKTLLIGDYLVANKVKYFFADPKREDIVTFRYPKIEKGTPEGSPEQFIRIFHPIYINKEFTFKKDPMTFLHVTYYARKNIVKRVIGMPGDTLEVRDKEVYVNGQLFKQGYECYGEPFPYDNPREIANRTIPQDMWMPGMTYWKDYPGSATWNRDWFGPVVVPQGKYFVMGDNRDVSEDSRYWGFLDRNDITGTPWAIFFSKGKEYNQIYDTPHIRWDRMFRRIR